MNVIEEACEYYTGRATMRTVGHNRGVVDNDAHRPASNSDDTLQSGRFK